MSIAYQVIRDFEKRVAKYTGAPYAVAVDSCTNAIFLALWYEKLMFKRNEKLLPEIKMPSRTYVSIPCSVIQAGYKVKFVNLDWKGIYRLYPTLVYDCAKRFTFEMYKRKTFMCLSFHGRKILNIGEGGMILHDDDEADEWFRVARFSGRHEVHYSKDTFEMVGWKMHMTPEQAARGLVLMDFIPKDNPDQEEDYPDLSKYSMFTEANR
jgi:dTDP-4-amino-4,6-dideoxygalactose transaminase